MGSNYFGDQPNYLGNERGAGLSPSSSSSSSRKGKKSGSDKPKQPQRGLGVAQLEKIRLHSQLGCNYLPSVHNPYASTFSQEDLRMQTSYSSSSSSFSYSSSTSPTYGFQGPHGVMMGLQDLDRANITYGDSQPSSVARWHPGNSGFGTQHFVEPTTTRSFFEPGIEGAVNKKKKKESSSQNSESSNSQEIDLELRLSL
ncbi:hypothetical protein BUALT_Bualt09G0023100 [Buddleja alternifolia]|uniref:Uncharacterized protein n=1 Tax=Buddleja alternifolia TaxID=168488 RepID=A0AAV6X0H1_9LAMI|nr:hypothetical protein BUALT_Bualt09G0023100 [Buddleja alternifolia]